MSQCAFKSCCASVELHLLALYFKVFTKFCCSFLASKATSELVVVSKALAAALGAVLALANCLVLSALTLDAFGAIATNTKSNGWSNSCLHHLSKMVRIYEYRWSNLKNDIQNRSIRFRNNQKWIWFLTDWKLGESINHQNFKELRKKQILKINEILQTWFRNKLSWKSWKLSIFSTSWKFGFELYFQLKRWFSTSWKSWKFSTFSTLLLCMKWIQGLKTPVQELFHAQTKE